MINKICSLHFPIIPYSYSNKKIRIFFKLTGEELLTQKSFKLLRRTEKVIITEFAYF